jgi:hypothetical protein
MDFHSKECVFLGYSPTHRGYKCLDSTGKIFISKDVVFNESRFPYTELFPSNQPISVTSESPTLSTFLPTPNPITTIPPSPSMHTSNLSSQQSPTPLESNPNTTTMSAPFTSPHSHNPLSSVNPSSPSPSTAT